MWVPAFGAISGVALMVFAGCLGPASDPASLDGPQIPAQALTLPTGVIPYTQLLCAGDLVKPLAGDHKADCNSKVTVKNGPAAEVSLAVNPLDSMNLVGGAKDFTLGEDTRCGKYNVWSGVYWSRDGGRTWGNGFLPGHPKDARKTAISEYACGSDPVLAFGPEGNVYYTSLHYQEDPNDRPAHPILAPVSGGQEKAGIAVTRSRDGGETWDDPVLVATRKGGAGLDKQWIATDPTTGQIYVSYIEIGGGGSLLVQRSDDQGQTWTKAVPVVTPHDLPGGPNAIQFGQIAVGPDSLVHFIYFGVRENEVPSGIFHKSSSDGGQTWSAPRTVGYFVPPADLGVVHKYRVVGTPALAVNPRDGSVYVAYPSRMVGDSDVFVAVSHDGGATWKMEDRRRINDDLTGPTNDQWMTAVAVSPDDSVHVTWLDYRDDPAGQWAYVYYSHSTDKGKTWSKNVRVSDVPFDGTGGYHQSGSGTIGDYMGLAASPHAVYPFWADTRDQSNDVFAAIILSGK